MTSISRRCSIRDARQRCSFAAANYSLWRSPGRFSNAFAHRTLQSKFDETKITRDIPARTGVSFAIYRSSFINPPNLISRLNLASGKKNSINSLKCRKCNYNRGLLSCRINVTRNGSRGRLSNGISKFSGRDPLKRERGAARQFVNYFRPLLRVLSAHHFPHGGPIYSRLFTDRNDR